jgi:DNA repair exonuclease SbcCD nuclease subunit
MARIVAISDAHLGRTHYHAVDDTGVNQREADIAAAWHRAVDAALALDPDAVLILGDLFDTPRPSYRAFREGARGLRTLAGAGVPVLAISGNHDTPRLRESGSPYAVLADAFPAMRMVFRGRLESVDLLAGVRVHAVPQCRDEAELKAQLAAAAAARSADHLNVAVTHAAVTLLSRRYTYGDVNELEVDVGAFDAGFDRVLLGHFHNFAQVAPNAWYPGATATLSFSDLPKADEPKVKGVCSLDTASGKVTHHPVPGGRELLTFAVDAFDRSAAEVYQLAGEQVEGDLGGAVVRVFVNRARPEVRRLLDRRVLGEAFPGALHVQVHVETVEDESAVQLAPEPAASLADEWDRYLAGVPIEGYDRDQLTALGRGFLTEAEEGGG